MKTRTIQLKLLFFLLSAILLVSTQLQAQITIGSNLAPASGALIDMKEHNATADSVTSEKGLLYPRVKLISKTNLFPMFTADGSNNYEIGGTSFTKSAEDKNHIGLIVYNVSSEGEFNPGLHIWDGAEWRRMDYSPVIQPQITSFLCGSVTMVPNKYSRAEDFDGILKVPYLGGNGGAYDGTAPVSIANGLQMELIGGRLAIGGGELMYHITGEPDITSPNTISININFLGKTCSSISVGNGESPLNLRNLSGDIDITALRSGGNYTTLNFGTITIPESGSYAFSLRLYGKMQYNATARYPFYIYLQRNATSTDNIIDAAEFDVVTINNPAAGTTNLYSDYSYSITLGGYFNAGETAVISMARSSASSWLLKSESSHTNPIRTSLIYWKL
jgi:hypothetical protein